MPRNAATNRFLQRNANAAILANGANGAAGNILSIANNASLNPTAAVTVEIWHRPRSLKAAILFDNSTAGVTDSYFSGIAADLSLIWYSTVGGAAKNITTTTSKLKLNEWNFITATYDGANIILMANGAIFGTLAATGSLGTNSGSLFIGAYYSGAAGLTTDGPFYRPRVYSAGCTLAEHQDRYYKSITSAALQAALELDLDTDRGAGTTVLDLSGNGNTATLGAGASWSGDVPFKSRKSSVNANMVKNGTFEYAPPFTAATTTAARWIDGTAAGSTTNDLFNWSFLAKTASGEVKFDSSVFRSGSSSLKLSATSTGSNIEAANVLSTSGANILAKAIPVIPNQSYVLTFWMKTNYVSGDSNEGAYVLVSYRNADGSGITSSASTKIKTTTDWTQYSVTVTTTAATYFFYLRPTIAGNSGAATLIMDAWFDDIVLTPVYPEGRVPADGNLVKNFDFEVAPTFVAATSTNQRWIDGSSAGSTTNATYKWGISGSGTYAGQFDSSVSRSGLYSMKLSTLATGSQCSLTNTRTTNLSDISVYGFSVLPNTSYTMTGWMKTNYVSGDATNGAALAVVERNAAGTAVLTNTTTYIKTTTDWTQYTSTFTTAASTVYLTFDHRVYGHQGTATLIMDAWFDDIYLAPTTNPGRVVIT